MDTMDTLTKPGPVKTPRGLGKGLSALMEENYSNAAAAQQRKLGNGYAGPSDGVTFEAPLDSIRPGRFQPRDYFDPQALSELAESIRQNGVMQPIILRRMEEKGAFEIIAGERRWRAARMAGLEFIPAITRTMDDKKVLEIALVENIQREDLKPLEEATGYQRLMSEFSYTQEQLSAVVHKSRSHIANLLRLLELPQEIRQLLAEDKITMGHARALFGVPDALSLVHDIIDRNLSVRETEKLARIGKGGTEQHPIRKARGEPPVATAPAAEIAPPAPPPPPQPVIQLSAPPEMAMPQQQPVPQSPAHRDPDIMALEETLSENLGLKVSINDQGQSGAITILYDSLEQLDDILRRLGGSI